MKTNKFFGLAALACGFAMSFTSCNNVDNPVLPPEEPEIVSATIGFENQALNDKGFWCGEVNEQGVDNGWGGMTYPCAYQEDIVKFNTTFGVSYWTGYAISNRTETGFTAGDFTPEGMPDQFNNITGKAHGGKNFAIVQTYGEKIEFDRPVTVKGFWYTNSSYTVNAEFDLAKDGDYVKTWQYCDLSGVEAFKNITSFGFGFEGTKKNEWGVTTPTYIGIDDIVIEYEK